MAEYAKRGLHGQVVAALGRSVVQGEYAPGDVLDLERLAQDFGVSRTVVREAVRALSARGLLDALPHRGTFVRPRIEWRLLDPEVMAWREGLIDAKFLSDLAEVRREIEPAGAALAASRHQDAELATLRSAFEALSTAAAARDAAATVAADLAFHRALLAASGNEVLTALEVLLEPALRVRGKLAFTREYRDDFVVLHGDVLDAVVRRDPQQAREAMHVLLREAAQTEIGSA